MDNTVKNYREKYTKRAKTRRRFVTCMTVVAAIVVVTVFYQLRGTGIARVNDVTENIADLSDSTADVEIAAEWEETLPEELSGVVCNDLISIAQSQVGYCESALNFSVDENGTHHGWTRYGAWNGNCYGIWNAPFVAWCLYYAGVDEEDFPFNSSAYAWAAQLKEDDLFLDASTYNPNKGDIIFLDTIGDNKVDTMGIVADILPADQTTLGETGLGVIEDDYDGMVEEVGIYITSPTILGYAIVPENEEEDITKETITLDATDDTSDVENVGDDDEITLEVANPEINVLNGDDGEEDEIIDTDTSEDTNELLEEDATPMPLDADDGGYDTYSDYSYAHNASVTPTIFSSTNSNTSSTTNGGYVDTLFLWGFAQKESDAKDLDTSNNATLGDADKIAGYSRWWNKTDTGNGTSANNWTASTETTDKYITVSDNISSDNRDIGYGIIDALTYTLTENEDSVEVTNTYYLVPIDYINTIYTTDRAIEQGAYWKFDTENVDASLTAFKENNPFVYDDYTSQPYNSSKDYINIYLATETPDLEYYEGNWYMRFKNLSNSSGGYDAASLYLYYVLPEDEMEFAISLDDSSGTVDSTTYHNYNYASTDSDSPKRYYMNLAVDDNTNELTIHLPSNADLAIYNTDDNPWVFVDGYDERPYSTCNNGFYYTGERTAAVNLEVEGGYDYKLIGWVDIATGEHYDVTYGYTDAVIEKGDGLNHVFYAEWIADSYDNALADANSFNGLKPDTVDTSNFISIEMFDYNEIFNLYSATIDSSDGAKGESWKDSGTFYNSLVGDKENEEPFLESDTTNKKYTTFIFNNDATNSAGGIGYVSNTNTYGNNQWYNPTPSSDSGRALYKAFPDIADDTQSTEPDTGVLLKLFDDTNSTPGTYYVGEANYLFSYENTYPEKEHYGYYYYSSTENAAAYQQSEGRFYVYNNKQEGYNKGSSVTSYDGMFLPYNKPDNSVDASDSNNKGYNAAGVYSGQVDYWFGMKMETSFYLPEDVGTTGTDGATNQIRGKNMVFEFSGDDDVWIFVDDTLVMDLTGIHDKTECTINFSTGEVTRDLSEYANEKRKNDTYDSKYNFYYQSSDDPTTQSDSGFQLESLSATEDGGLKAGDHTLTIYYLERGAYASNLTISFNIVPHWYYDLLEVVTTSITKEWALSDGTTLSGKNIGDIKLDLTAEVGLFALATERQYTDVGEKYPLLYNEDDEKWYYYDDWGDDDKDAVYYEVQEDGWIYDDSGGVVGFFTDSEEIAKTMNLSMNSLYLFVENKTLSYANNWQYTWAILSSTSDYIVLEMDSTEGYYVSSTRVDELTDWVYWKIIGTAEINGMYEQHVNNNTDYTYTIHTVDGSTDIPILLTDAGFNEKDSTKDITGEVLTHEVSHQDDFGGLYREYYPITSAPSGSRYGVYSDSVIGYMNVNGNSIDPECSAVWYLEYTKDEIADDTLSSQQEEEFYIYCWINGEKYYLTEKAWSDETITDGSDQYIPDSETHHLALCSAASLNESKQSPMKMYYSTVGELIIVPDDNNTESLEKIVMTSSGYVQITSAYIAQGDPYNIRIYVLDTVKTTGYIYTITNTEITYELPSTGGNVFVVWGVGIAVILVSSTGIILVRRGRRSRKR